MEQLKGRGRSHRIRRRVVQGPEDKFADVEETKQEAGASVSQASQDSSESLADEREEVDSDFDMPESVVSEVPLTSSNDCQPSPTTSPSPMPKPHVSIPN